MKTEGFTHFGLVKRKTEAALAGKCVEQFRVHAPSIESPVANLSGGNQQKVVLSRCFATNPCLVVLAEPTRGIDVGAKGEIYGFIQDLAEKSAGIIMISSELPELLGLTDRILVFYQGELCGEFDPRTSREEDIAHAACTGRALRAGARESASQMEEC